MKVSYYPGCTLKTRAKRMDEAARASLLALGVELVEPQRWTCCGVVNTLTDDDVMRFIGPVRNLIRIRNEGNDKVVVTCSMCYSALARANRLMKGESDRKRTVNLYFEDEADYNGEVEVVHLLPFIRDTVGWDALKARVVAPFAAKPVAAYYGCALLRPKELSIVPDIAEPRIFEEFLEALGATVVDFPDFSRCCSSYQSVTRPEVAADVAEDVIQSARKAGAGAIVTACPLCDYNLGELQRARGKTEGNGAPVETIYFTEVMASALGVPYPA